MSGDLLVPLECEKVAELAVDLWKIQERARSEGGSERMIASIERATDRYRRYGFTTEDLTGRPYDTNMRVQVVQHDDGEGPMTITECISPAVYFKGVLIWEAEVVTTGSRAKDVANG